jgi:hypothetical protein
MEQVRLFWLFHFRKFHIVCDLVPLLPPARYYFDSTGTIANSFSEGSSCLSRASYVAADFSCEGFRNKLCS